MVQALREIISDENYNETFLREVLSSFKCARDDKDSRDVEEFLKNDAIDNEILGVSRTYLIINDNAWNDGIVQIDGYFSLALKALWFNNVGDKQILESGFRDSKVKHGAAFLIGQLARASCAPKGSGRQYLDIALSYIASVCDIIGGRFVYLECNPDRRKYYEEQGFAFLQMHKEYVQMYKII